MAPCAAECKWVLWEFLWKQQPRELFEYPETVSIISGTFSGWFFGPSLSIL
jgi:hypothetical protein